MCFFQQKNYIINFKRKNTQLYWCEKKDLKLEIINMGTLLV